MGNMSESLIIQGSDTQNMSGPAQMSSEEFGTMLLEIQEQPAWRGNADIESDYYDGQQLDAETLVAMKELGMAPIIENLTAPTIDSILGLEAKTRLDWKVSANGDEQFAEVAEAMNMKIKEAESETHADRACSDAFAAQVKAGLGWIEVARDHDPFRYPYRCEYVHRNEIFWDFRGKRLDTTDWRYLVRKRWNDADVLSLVFPEHRELLTSSVRGWSGFDPTMLIDGGRSTGLAMDYGRERAWTLEEQEWRDTYRRRLCLSEVWYRRWIRGHIMKTPDGRVIEFDRANRQHIEAVAYNMVKVQAAVFSKVRLAWFVGPHKLADVPTPYKHDKFPYVPFIGKREDMTGVPYGAIRAMKPLQDEINARNTKMVWLLAAKRVTMTEGVTKDSPEVVRAEAARPDAMHVLDPQMLMQGGIFKVETDFQLNAQQYNVLQDKRQAIKNVAGVYASFEGNQKAAISGIAANTLVEQSTQTLAEIMDNFQFARRQVGELLLSLIIEDIGDEEHQVNIDNEINGSKSIVLNQPTPHPSGETVLTNSVQQARLRVALSDVPSTSSYRSQRLMMLTEITKSLPPEYQGLVLDFVMAATDLPERAEIVKRIRSKLGLAEKKPPKTQEEAMALQQAQQQQQQVEQLQLRDTEATIADKEAKARKTAAEADEIAARVDSLRNTPQQTDPQVAELQARMAGVDQQLSEALQEHQLHLMEARQEYQKSLDTLRAQLEEEKRAAIERQRDIDGQVEVARIEADTRRLEAEAETERSRITAEANSKQEAIEERFSKQVEALNAQIAALKEEITKKQGDGKDDDELEGKEKPAPVIPNITVPVNVTIERGGGAKTATMKRNEDGSYGVSIDDEKPATPVTKAKGAK